jgi:hypothetical protein
VLALVAYLAISADVVAEPATDPIFDPVAARAEHFGPGEPRVLAK